MTCFGVEVRVGPDRLERGLAVDDRVAHQVDVAHAAAADVALDLVASEACARHHRAARAGGEPGGRAHARWAAPGASAPRRGRPGWDGRCPAAASRTVRAPPGAAVGASSVGMSPSRHLAAAARVAGRQAGGERPRHRRRRRRTPPGAVAASGQLPGGSAEQARAGAGLAQALHALGHVLEAGIDVEDLLVDEVGLVALPAVLVVESQVDVDELHVVGAGAACRTSRAPCRACPSPGSSGRAASGSRPSRRRRRASPSRSRSAAVRHEQRDRRDEREAGIDDLEPDALLHEQERRPAQQDQREQGDADEQQPASTGAAAATRRGRRRRGRAPTPSSHAHTGAAHEVEAEDVVEEGGVDQDARRLDREREVAVVETRGRARPRARPCRGTPRRARRPAPRPGTSTGGRPSRRRPAS